MKRIVAMVSGGGSNLQAILDGCAAGEIEGRVVGVISSAAKAFALERGKLCGAETLALPLRSFPDRAACDAARHEALVRLEPDLIVLAGYLGIVPVQSVARFRGRILNIHPALIPKFCGKGMYGHHVHEAVLAAGEAISGATVHFVDEGTDTGPIVFQDTVPVLPEDTADSLAARVLKVEHRLLPLAVKLFCADRLCQRGGRAEIRDPGEARGEIERMGYRLEDDIWARGATR